MQLENRNIVKCILLTLVTCGIYGIVWGVKLARDAVKVKDVNEEIHEMCHDDNCHCEDGIIKSALKHTVSIIFFILIFNFIGQFFVAIVSRNRSGYNIKYKLYKNSVKCLKYDKYLTFKAK